MTESSYIPSSTAVLCKIVQIDVTSVKFCTKIEFDELNISVGRATPKMVYLQFYRSGINYLNS